VHAGPAAEQVMLLENIGTSVLVSDNQVPMSLLKLIYFFQFFYPLMDRSVPIRFA
jgi:hypothetical protein